jgi:BlaI family transcriptional regulator, penicillinase repressor
MSSPPRISETEWEIMRIIWDRSPRSASEIIATLQTEDKIWHPKTAKTLLGRLVKKGALEFDRDGRAYLYRPVVSEDECVRAVSESFLKLVFDDSVQKLMVHFAQNKQLSAKEIRELKEILKQTEKKK